tara:strand:+ start:220 stop:828 length:609 start_codon:yes stop_codon:yes gene_type:complete
MSKDLVYISWGHLGAHGVTPSTGAKSPDGDFWEVIEVGKYVQAMMATLLKADVHVIIAGGGSLVARQRRACEHARYNDFSRVAYVSCHLNWIPDDPPKQRAVFFHDERSRGGKALARSIREEVHARPILISQPSVRGTRDDNWTKNAHACIEYVYDGPANISAVLCEPFAMNATPEINIWDLEAMGEAIAHGILNWLKGEEK